MVARGRHVSCLLTVLAVGCSDGSNAPGAPSTSQQPSSGASTTGLSAPKLTPAEIERYRIELTRLMPEPRVVSRHAAPGPSGAEVVDVEGFDRVMLARRRPDGKIEHACVGTVNDAMEFVGGSNGKVETE